MEKIHEVEASWFVPVFATLITKIENDTSIGKFLKSSDNKDTKTISVFVLIFEQVHLVL